MNKNSALSERLKSIKKIAGFTALGLLGFVAFTFILIILEVIKDPGTVFWKFLASSGIIGLFCGFTVANITKIESNNKVVKIAAIVALLSSFVCLILWLMLVWDCFDYLKAQCSTIDIFGYSVVTDNDCAYYDVINNVWKTLAVMWSTIVGATITAVYMGFETRKQAVKIMSMVAVVCALILCGVIDMVAITESYTILTTYSKLFAIIYIVEGFSLIAAPIMHLMEKKSSKDEEKSEMRNEVESEMRAEIEKEMREKIEKEMAQKAKLAAPSPIQSQAAPATEVNAVTQPSGGEAAAPTGEASIQATPSLVQSNENEPAVAGSNSGAPVAPSNDTPSSDQNTELPTPM